MKSEKVKDPIPSSSSDAASGGTSPAKPSPSALAGGAKWTPGPWDKIVHGDMSSRVGANTLLAVVYSTAFRDDENRIANAHLIAAAPELYAALALYVEHFGDPLKVARAALAKARGETDARGESE